MSRNVCRVCTGPIYLMCRKGTGICGELCEKREKNIQKDNLEAYKHEMETPFVFHEATVTPEIVLPDSKLERPSVPSLLGWRVAAQIERAGRLMVGDIRRNPDQTFDMWAGENWVKYELVAATNG